MYTLGRVSLFELIKTSIPKKIKTIVFSHFDNSWSHFVSWWMVCYGLALGCYGIFRI